MDRHLLAVYDKSAKAWMGDREKSRFLRVAAPVILFAMPPDFREVDPTDLRVPSSRSAGADPVKLQRQISQFGASVVGLPPLWVYEAADGNSTKIGDLVS